MSLFTDFISLIYPRSCVCCSKLLLKEEEFICNYCYVNLPKSNFHAEEDCELDRVFHGRVRVEKTGSYLLFEKSGTVQRILHSIKYRKNTKLAYNLGQLYGETLKQNDSFSKCDIIVPVPLHRLKQKERGFNQSEEFAKGLSKSLNIPLSSDNLIRLDYTSSQTRKNRAERWENVKDKFEIQRPNEFQNKNILLIDDVITTGATIEACCSPLVKLPINNLYVASLAYATKN